MWHPAQEIRIIGADRKVGNSMKLIHCADLHLDSKMESHLSKEQAKQRKTELLETYMNMVDYAETNGVSAVLIAGDLFDKKVIGVHAKKTVMDTIRQHPDINFYYLQGNHDLSGFISNQEKSNRDADHTTEDTNAVENIVNAVEKDTEGSEIPKNLHTFSEHWQSYILGTSEKGNIVLTGVELNADNQNTIYETLLLRPQDFNIVTLHGQLAKYKPKDHVEVINLGELRNKSIDYLALGHVHSYEEGQLLPRGVYCYPGCLEGRGFDETGEHGFVLLDINEESLTMQRTFVPFAKRNFYAVPVDVSACLSTTEMLPLVEKALNDCEANPKDLVKIVLTGNVDVNCEKNPELIVSRFKDRYYYLRVKDETKVAVHYTDFKNDKSLKGELVRLLEEDSSLSEDEKSAIIRVGLQALNGEQIEL